MDYDYARASPEGAPLARVSTRDSRDEYRTTDLRDNRRRSPDRRRDRDRRDDRRDRDRRRSRSPALIDRYEPDRVPRDDYYTRRVDDSRRDRRRSSAGRDGPTVIDRYVPNHQENAPILVNPIQDPMTLETQAGFSYFAEHWRHEKRIKEEKEFAKNGRRPQLRGERETRTDRDTERPLIQAAYDLYKATLTKKQAQQFVRGHKHEDWFRERYVAEVRDPFRKELMAFRCGLYEQWVVDLSKGTFDDFTLEGIYRSESNGAGGMLEKEEGETSAAAEVLGVSDLVPCLGGDLRDPISQLPALLIKTVGPAVTRDNLVSLAKENLGEGDGGYKHLSLSDPNPLKKCHRMGWVMLNPGADIEPKVEPDESTADINSEDAEQTQSARPLSVGDLALQKINGKVIEDAQRGDFTVHFALHRPPTEPRKKALWDLFSAPERITRDAELATRLVRQLDNEMGDNYFGVAKILQRVEQLSERGHLKPAAPSKPSKSSDNMDTVEEGEEPEEEGMIDEESESDGANLLLAKKNLDLLIEYLRRVHNFCFYCVFESDSVHELQRKCPGGHLRRPRASLTTAAMEVAKASAAAKDFPLKGGRRADRAESPVEEGEMEIENADGNADEDRKFNNLSSKTVQQLQRAYKWVKTFEDKILQLLEPSNVDIRKLGGTPLDEGVDEVLKKFVKQEDESKYRCKVPECTKLFKGTEFWRKHVEKRHADFYALMRSDVELVNTYVLDPAHIAPGRSDANSNGHFPINVSGQLSGTPRGFQFNTQLGFPMAGGMTPAGFAGGMYGPPGMTTGWGPPGSATNPIPGMMTGIGPMRTGGFRTGGFRMPGPYARPDGRGRQPSFNGGRGMVSDGMIGPAAATSGRPLRSYEDLDAAAPGDNNTTTELDY